MDSSLRTISAGRSPARFPVRRGDRRARARSMRFFERDDHIYRAPTQPGAGRSGAPIHRLRPLSRSPGRSRSRHAGMEGRIGQPSARGACSGAHLRAANARRHADPPKPDTNANARANRGDPGIRRLHPQPRIPEVSRPDQHGRTDPRDGLRRGNNVRQPAAMQAADACVSITHGVITKTAVARFIAGQ